MAKRRSKTKRPTLVDAIKHKDSRVNIPIEELLDFAADEEQAPKQLPLDAQRTIRAVLAATTASATV